MQPATHARPVPMPAPLSAAARSSPRCRSPRSALAVAALAALAQDDHRHPRLFQFRRGEIRARLRASRLRQPRRAQGRRDRDLDDRHLRQLQPLRPRRRDGGADHASARKACWSRTADDAYGTYCFLCTTMEYPEDIKWVIFNLRDDVDLFRRHADDGRGRRVLLQPVPGAGHRRVPRHRRRVARERRGARRPHRSSSPSPTRPRCASGSASPAARRCSPRPGSRKPAPGSTKPRTRRSWRPAPYVLDSAETNARVVYRYNPDYWGADQPFSIGQQQFRDHPGRVFRRPDRRLRGLQGRAPTPSAPRTARRTGPRPTISRASRTGWVIKAELPDGTVGTAPELRLQPRRRDLGQDPRVREALGHDVQLRMVEPVAVLRALRPGRQLLAGLRPRRHRHAVRGRDSRCCSRWSTTGCCPRAS